MNLEPKLVIWPNNLLSTPSVPVQPDFDPEYIKLITDSMFKVMYRHNGVGISAVQVGILLNIVVMDCSNQIRNLQDNIDPKALILINPVIEKFIGEKELLMEGCLSFPGIIEQVLRYPEVIIEAKNLNGVDCRYQMAGLEAQCIAHEIEHLNGITFDKEWGRTKKDIINRKIRKFINAK